MQVKRNDELTLSQIDALQPQKIVISPGPCTPDDAGISLEVIRHYAGRLPILGVCPGHQAMAQAFGATIVRAEKVMHGKTSPIHHTGQGVFQGLTNPLTVTRYHSLIIDPTTLPDCFEVTARAKHRKLWGFAIRCGIWKGAVPPGEYSQRAGTSIAGKFPQSVICDCYPVIFYAYFVIIFSHSFLHNWMGMRWQLNKRQ